MAQFSKIIITEEGKKMLNQAFSFGKKVDFTEASTSEKSYEEEELSSLCELQEIRQTIPIKHVVREGDTIEIKLAFENDALEAGYYLRTLGVYGEIEGEAPILFAAAKEQTENLYLPAGRTAVSGVSIKWNMQLESEAAVQLVVDKAGVATVGDVLMISNELTKHQQDQKNPHGVTKSQVGLGNADNTSDMDKPVSNAQQTAFDNYYQQSAEYTDQKIAQLIDGAPETLDTLKEVADAFSENETVVGALNEAIRKKIDKEEALSKTGDSKDNTVTFSSEDKLEPVSWSEVPLLASGEKHNGILGKVSTMFQNIRWLYKKLGTTDISSLGGGTVTGALSKLNTDLTNTASSIPSRTSQLQNDSGFKTTDTTYEMATQSENGLMSAADKQKLDGIASGAQKNTITGIKGNSESSYRTGNVNLTPANIGAAASSHTHSYLPLSGGTLTGSLNVSGGRIASLPVYESTTTGSANLVVQSTGWMQRHSSSSKRYKHDIKEMDINFIKKLYKLPIVTFKYNDDYIDQKDERYRKEIPGIIVEDLENILPVAVNHENGKPEMWNNNILIPCLLKLIQDLDERLSQLEK